MKSLSYYFPYFGTCCVAKIAYVQKDCIQIDTSQHTVIFSGYTGPIYLMDFDRHIIILVMTNSCRLSTKNRIE